MTFFDAIILAIVQGVTEFLPVSSTGHMILASKLMGLTTTEFLTTFFIVIQLGSVLAIVLLYRQKLLQGPKVWKNILLAFLPTAVIAFAVYPFVKGVLLASPMVVVVSLLVGGVLILLIEKFYQPSEEAVAEIEDLSWQRTLALGVIQTLAVIPGVSRSGATIFGGMLLGFSRKTAADFSFLLAIPTMMAASGYDLLSSGSSYSGYEFALLAVGFVGAFVVAYIVVKQFLRFVQTHSFVIFGWYRIVAAVLFYLIMLR